MKEQAVRERECVHRSGGAAGDYYRGSAYVERLQRLRSGAAMKITGKVAAFFWSDAEHVVVWLCADCAAELGLAGGDANQPRSFSRS